MRVCIYGTVYNNAPYVEYSVRSVWRPDAEIVVVDSFSTDGTWEKLVELKRDFNIKLYRYKCSRGLGRHIALLKCSENTITSYFDLDTVYNANFHKAIDAGEVYGSIKYNGGLVIRREEALRKGGWRDLNCAEDIEFAVRMNPRVFVPVEVGENACLGLYGFFREKRYAKGPSYIKRVLEVHRDYIKGTGLGFHDILQYRSKRLAILSPLLFPWFLENYRLLESMDNLLLENILVLSRIKDPKELGMDDSYFFLSLNYKLLRTIKQGERTIDQIIKKRYKGKLYKIRTSSRYFSLVYVKNPLVLKHSLFILPIVKKIEVL